MSADMGGQPMDDDGSIIDETKDRGLSYWVNLGLPTARNGGKPTIREILRSLVEYGGGPGWGTTLDWNESTADRSDMKLTVHPASL